MKAKLIIAILVLNCLVLPAFADRAYHHQQDWSRLIPPLTPQTFYNHRNWWYDNPTNLYNKRYFYFPRNYNSFGYRYDFYYYGSVCTNEQILRGTCW